VFALDATSSLRNLSGCRFYEGAVIARQLKSEPPVSDEDCLDDCLLAFAFEARAMNDTGAVWIREMRSTEANITAAACAFGASISTSLNA
jgi:hypothetical protein